MALFSFLERNLAELADDQATLDSSGGIESPTSMDSTIGDAWAEISKGMEPVQETVVRDASGKFAKKEETPAATPAPVAEVPAEVVAEVPAEEIPAAPAPEAKKAPSSWKKEAAEAFAALPPHVQDEVLRREGDIHKGIESYRTQAETGKRFESALAPYMQTIQQLGVTPEAAVSALMKADHTLRYAPPAVKAQEFQKLAQVYGIDLSQQFDPNVAALQNEVYQLRQQQEQWQHQQQTQVQQSLNSDIERFAAEPGREHFGAVRDHMAALLQGGQAKDLADAYDQAVYANPQTRAAVLAKQLEAQRAEQTRKAKEARTAASVNVAARGTVAAGAPARIPWNDADIKADAQRLGLA